MLTLRPSTPSLICSGEFLFVFTQRVFSTGLDSSCQQRVKNIFTGAKKVVTTHVQNRTVLLAFYSLDLKITHNLIHTRILFEVGKVLAQLS